MNFIDSEWKLQWKNQPIGAVLESCVLSAGKPASIYHLSGHRKTKSAAAGSRMERKKACVGLKKSLLPPNRAHLCLLHRPRDLNNGPACRHAAAPAAGTCRNMRAIRLFSHLIVPQLKPRLLPVGKDLPQDDSEAPNVAFCGEFPVHDALRGHPADREHGVSADLQAGEGIFVTNGGRLETRVISRQGINSPCM